jgi:regulator of protease activity HflC (stomatin/prohibitin superfamily)
MITLLVIFAILLVTTLFIRGRITTTFKQTGHEYLKNGARVAGITAGLFVALMVVTLLANSFYSVDSGNIGVEKLFGKVLDERVPEGLNAINPLVTVEEMTLRTQSYTMSAVSNEGQVKGNDAIDIITSDGLTVTVELSVLFRLNPNAASWVFRSFGPDYVSQIVRPAIRSSVRDIFSKYNSQDLYSTKREEATQKAQQHLQDAIDVLTKRSGYNLEAIMVENVLTRDIKLPDAVKTAIENKIAAQQQAEQMEYVIQKEQKEADRKRVEAQGIRDFQLTVSQGISPQLLQWKGIEATTELAKSTNAKVVIIGSGKDGLPIIFDAKQ